MTRDGIDPCSREDALQRMQALADRRDISYRLGTGGYHPGRVQREYDCAGAIVDAYKLTRTRKGFARVRVPAIYRDVADVDDVINTSALVEDALTTRELVEVVLEGPVLPGDLVVYAGLWIDGKKFIGHVGMFKIVPPGWTPAAGYRLVRILQCCGPNGRSPGVIETDGALFDRHDRKWPKMPHRTMVLRVRS